MAEITLLPDDLLGDVLVLASTTSIYQKFSVSQVSRRWRRVALGTPFLWSSWRLSTLTMNETNIHSCLSTVLDRIGTFVLLDILQVICDSHHTLGMVMRMLVPHASRIRTLNVRFLGDKPVDTRFLPVQQTVSPLLDGQLHLPALDTLRLDIESWRWLPDLRVASAPALRTLDLQHVALCDMDILLPPTLEDLRFAFCDYQKLSDLQVILERCPRLSRLCFLMGYYEEEDTSFDGLAQTAQRTLAPALRSLELRMSLEDAVKVLDTGFETVPPVEIDVCIFAGYNSDHMKLLVGALLRGAGPLVSFEARDRQRIVLRDSAGNVRAMSVSEDWSGWKIIDVWFVLAKRHGINASVCTIQVSTRIWQEFCWGLLNYPLRTKAGIRMRILTEWEDVHRARKGNLRSLRMVDVTAVDCIELASDDATGIHAEVVVDILRSFCCNQPHPRRLVLEGAAPLLRGNELEDFQQSMRSQVALVSSDWELSFK